MSTARWSRRTCHLGWSLKEVPPPSLFSFSFLLLFDSEGISFTGISLEIGPCSPFHPFFFFSFSFFFFPFLCFTIIGVAPDLYAIGFQEFDLTRESYMAIDEARVQKWDEAIQKSLQQVGNYVQVLSFLFLSSLLSSLSCQGSRSHAHPVFTL